MKRIYFYTFWFVVSLVGCACTITSLGWFFWVSISVFVVTCSRMDKYYKVLHGELDDIFGSDSRMK